MATILRLHFLICTSDTTLALKSSFIKMLLSCSKQSAALSMRSVPGPLKLRTPVVRRSMVSAFCEASSSATKGFHGYARTLLLKKTTGQSRTSIIRRAHDESKGDNVEVKVDSVKVSHGTSVVFLRLCGQTPGLVLPVHIGEAESSALLKEINKQKGMRPMTHDITKHLLQAAGFKVVKIRITELVSSTYYSRIHIARINSKGEATDEVDVDSRPSDAINLAVRFDAPMYISRQVANYATTYPNQDNFSSHSESNAEIVRSVRETLASFEDPTTMLQLHKDLAVQEERYADAQAFQQQIFDQMIHSVMLRMVVAMEAALADGRFEEAARVRDEYKRAVAAAVQPADSGTKTTH